MLNIPTITQDIIDGIKKAIWFFDVTTTGGATYYWANTAIDIQPFEVMWETTVLWETGVEWEPQTYTASVSGFSDVTMQRSATETNQMSFNSATMTVPNKGNSLTASDFDSAAVLIRLWVHDGTNGAIAATWRMKVSDGGVINYDQVLTFTLEGFLKKYCDGVYPNGSLISAIAPEYSSTSDTACVPEIFGTAYSPMACILDSGTSDRHYLLGLSSHTYTITKVHTPEQADAAIEWDSGSYTFTQKNYTFGGTTYRVVAPVVFDSDGDGTVDSTGLWKSGDSYLPANIKLTRNDTATKTSPIDIIQFILEDFGVPTAYIDVDGTFASTKSTVSGWGLDWNFALTKKEDRRSLLARLLNACNCYLIETDKVEIHPYLKTSRQTFDDSLIKKVGNKVTDKSSFSQSTTLTTETDSGYVKYHDTTYPEYMAVKAIAAPNSTTAAIDTSELFVPNDDSQVSIRIGELHYIRRIYKEGTRSFSYLPTVMKIQPGDVVTISDTKYGGTYNVMANKVTIANDLTISLSADKYSIALEDFADSTPGAVTPASDDSEAYWAGMTTIYIGGNSRFQTLQDAMSVYGGGRFLLRNGVYTLPSGGIEFGDYDIHIIGDTRNGVKIKSYTNSEGFNMGAGSYGARTWMLENITLESQNATGNYKKFFYFQDGDESLSFKLKDIDINLNDDNRPNGTVLTYADIGIELNYFRMADLENVRQIGGGTLLNAIMYDYGTTQLNDIIRVRNCRAESVMGYWLYLVSNRVAISGNKGIDFFGGTFVGVAGSVYSSVVDKNEVTLRDITGTGYVSNDIFIVGTGCNDVALTNNAVQSDQQNRTDTNHFSAFTVGANRVQTDNNRINIIANRDATYTYGIKITSVSNQVSTSNNVIEIDNAGVSTYYNKAIYSDGDGGTIQGNIIDMVNSGANDYGIEITASGDDNDGGDNIVKNAGTSINDLGANNTVTVKSI